MSNNKLVGYIRKSKSGGALRLSIDVAAFDEVRRYLSKDCRDFVSLIVNADKAGQILAGEREVTSVVSLDDRDE
jgi:hypothetical protein